MKELTDEQLKILAQLTQKQAEKDAISDSQNIRISNPDKYVFPVGISETLILCPYCLGIIDEEAINCTYCENDITRDDSIKMTACEYQDAERHICKHCSSYKLKLAKVCSNCGN